MSDSTDHDLLEMIQRFIDHGYRIEFGPGKYAGNIAIKAVGARVDDKRDHATLWTDTALNADTIRKVMTEGDIFGDQVNLLLHRMQGMLDALNESHREKQRPPFPYVTLAENTRLKEELHQLQYEVEHYGTKAELEKDLQSAIAEVFEKYRGTGE